MDRQDLYDNMAERKSKPVDFDTYNGNNGRVNRCVKLFDQGVLQSGDTLLDVGGGIGDLGCSLRDRFKECIVLDISRTNLKAASSKGNRTILADVDKGGIPLTDGSVTTLVALDFIEHIVDPENFARECFRVLEPGGQVFINTPNIQFFRHQESLLYRGIFPHTSGDREVYHGGHLAFYTFVDMVTIFGAAGFSEHQQVMDEEGYVEPPQFFIDSFWQGIRQGRNDAMTQNDWKTICMRLGCPNLLFKCVK